MLVLPDIVRAQLLAEAGAALPAECCGLLEGLRRGADVEITAAHAAANVAADPRTGFLIDPQAHFRLLRSLRATGRNIIGCYHSHPNGRPGPSPRDRAAICETGFVWVIIATGVTPEIGAFQTPDFAPMTLQG